MEVLLLRTLAHAGNVSECLDYQFMELLKCTAHRGLETPACLFTKCRG